MELKTIALAAALAVAGTSAVAQDTLEPGQSPTCAALENKGCFAFYVLEDPLPVGETILSASIAENGYDGVTPLTQMQPGRYVLVKTDA